MTNGAVSAGQMVVLLSGVNFNANILFIHGIKPNVLSEPHIDKQLLLIAPTMIAVSFNKQYLCGEHKQLLAMAAQVQWLILCSLATTIPLSVLIKLCH